MQIVPLTTIPSQVFDIQINGLSWRIAVVEKKGYDDSGNPTPRLFCDIALNGVQLVLATLASLGVPLLRHPYLNVGSTADFIFVDTKGNDNPVASGLGTRWFMMAFDATDF